MRNWKRRTFEKKFLYSLLYFLHPPFFIIIASLNDCMYIKVFFFLCKVIWKLKRRKLRKEMRTHGGRVRRRLAPLFWPIILYNGRLFYLRIILNGNGNGKVKRVFLYEYKGIYTLTIVVVFVDVRIEILFSFTSSFVVSCELFFRRSIPLG